MTKQAQHSGGISFAFPQIMALRSNSDNGNGYKLGVVTKSASMTATATGHLCLLLIESLFLLRFFRLTGFQKIQ